jgi:hypothetical protein
MNTNISATIPKTTPGNNFRTNVKVDIDYNVKEGDGIGVYVSVPLSMGGKFPFVSIGYVPLV